MKVIKQFLKFIICISPWRLKRLMLNYFFDYHIAVTAYIGFSWIFPKKLIMEEGAKIDHFTVAIHLDLIEMAPKSTIGRSNWITGFSTITSSLHFTHRKDRKAELILGESSAITKQHHLDCTNQIHIGKYTTIAGYQSQFITHSIDLAENRQDSKPIMIGDYVFVGTNVVVLGGASLPSYSILGAKSLLNKAFIENWTLYGGVPAKKINSIDRTDKYFNRIEGFVY